VGPIPVINAAQRRARRGRRHQLASSGHSATPVDVVPREVAPIIQSACTRAIAAQERRRAVQLCGNAGLADDLASWLVGVENATFEALEKRGEATAQELGQDVPDLRKQVLFAAEKAAEAAHDLTRWLGEVRITLRFRTPLERELSAC
jgi:hypothetical protein